MKRIRLPAAIVALALGTLGLERDVRECVRANTGFKATTERETMDLHMIEMDAGNWLIVEIPGFANADSGLSVDSLDALHNADVTS